jgi:hypothetical protein
MSGLRAKLMYIFTATGLMAPVFNAVSGLTFEELTIETCPSGILPLKLKDSWWWEGVLRMWEYKAKDLCCSFEMMKIVTKTRNECAAITALYSFCL